ncbi:MAG: tRNA-dihydrouridine synthase [Burkholderiaceae bacterium]
MTVILAPMEGLLDFVLRDILTRAGGVDRCVSEFIRVTNTVLPDRVYMRVVPELLTGWRTFAGVPVRPQLLGSDPACLADNAAALARLSPPGIDLNFGCPAKVVNRHGGGAALLDEPELVAQIVTAVRRAVPPHIAVSAKMRLGFNDDSRAEECAIAIAESGANELVVHARTKADGYRPPAYWSRIADVRAVVNIPVVANGEIWHVADAQRCRELSGCNMLMIGRGMVTDPSLARAIQAMDATNASAAATKLDWHSLFPLIQDFWDLVGRRLDKKSRTGRLKQWLNFLRRSYPEAETAYMALRIYNEPERVDAWLACERLAREQLSIRP